MNLAYTIVAVPIWSLLGLMCSFIISAHAKEFSVNDQDQTAIQQICDLAAASTVLNREVRAQVATWCVLWDKRMQEANKPEPKSTAEPSK